MKKLFRGLVELILPEYTILVFFSLIIGFMALGGTIYQIYLIILPLLSFSFGAFGLNVINNVCDINLDVINKPSRALPSKKIRVKTAILFSTGLMLTSFLLTLLINYLTSIFIGLLIILALLYSAPPIRLKKITLSDGIIGGFLYGVFPLISLWSIMGGDFPAMFIIILFFLILSISPIKNIEDVEGEKKEKIKTIPVLFGIKNSIKISVFIDVMLSVSVLILSISELINYVFLYPSIFSLLILSALYQYLIKKSEIIETVRTQSRIVTVSMLVISSIGLLYGITSLFL